MQGEPSAAYVLRLARSKAHAAVGQSQTHEMILAADTTVADGDLILGKPSGPEEAREMLRSLRGRDHMVYTAIGVADPSSGRLETDLCAARVWMRDYSDEEVEAYIASGDPFDKAGGYAIQNLMFHPVERIEGCYACVVGLPVCQVARLLQDFGLQPDANIAADCSKHLALNAPCPVSQNILGGRSSEMRSGARQDEGKDK